jgi:fucose 4-O-acetylase-like acetyltransferase
VQARQCLALLRSDAGQATLYLALLFQQVITNLSETHWFSVLSLDFLLTTLTTTALARALLERRLLHAYGTPVRPGEA